MPDDGWSLSKFEHGDAPGAPAVLLLDRWLDHLEALVAHRVRQALGQVPAGGDPPVMVMAHGFDDGSFARFVERRGLPPEDILLLVVALAPWVRPDLFDRIVGECRSEGGNLEMLGGVRGTQHRGMLPTGDTVLCLLAGSDTAARLRWQAGLLGDAPIVREGIAYLEPAVGSEPPMSGRFVVDPDVAELILTGANRAPRMTEKFPAQRLETGLDWSSLVLPAQTLARVMELRGWIEHRRTLLDDWDMRAKLRPGCRALFFGPPGTGKTLTATLLGKLAGREVFRVDLSRVVSKYIGETEKNLAALFDKAENKDWILFFDEGDALFGKRAQVRDARDRYANQEVSFLLQRIETFDGLAILASNLTNNVDTAFSRRFEHVVHFPMPKTGERLALWRKSLPDRAELEAGLDLAGLAARFELSGGTIMNVVRHACLQAIVRGEATLLRADFEEGVRREYAKENRLQ